MVQFTFSKDTSTTWQYRSKSAEYDPASTLRYAYDMGVIPRDTLTIPMELVHQLYPGFDLQGLPALLGEYAEEHARKADKALTLSADEVAVMKIAAPGWMFNLSVDEEEFEFGSAGFYLYQIILAWPRSIDNPPRVPITNRGNGAYLVKLIDVAPSRFRELLPPHVRAWWNYKSAPVVMSNTNLTMWNTVIGTSTRTYNK